MGNPQIGVWRNDPKLKEGKYPVLLRRDGTMPKWPYFVLGARDSAAPSALYEYARVGRLERFDSKYCRDVELLANEFQDFPGTGVGYGDPDKGPHRTDHPLVLALARGLLTFEDLSQAFVERERSECRRAGGGVICEACGKDYHHHPADASPYEWLTVLCNQRRVKL